AKAAVDKELRFIPRGEPEFLDMDCNVGTNGARGDPYLSRPGGVEKVTSCQLEGLPSVEDAVSWLLFLSEDILRPMGSFCDLFDALHSSQIYPLGSKFSGPVELFLRSRSRPISFNNEDRCEP